MHADGMTCRMRYSPVVTQGLCGTERIVAGDPHSIVAGVDHHGCDGHQGAMSITSPILVVLSF